MVVEKLPSARALRSDAIDAATIDMATRKAMYALFERYYMSSSFERFEKDLAGKDTVFLIHNDQGVLCGFSTLAVSTAQFDGAPIRVAFSGDTVIDPAFWGSQAFAYRWIRHIGTLASQPPELPLYWLLTVKGHRTFRYLPAFGLRFVPDWRTSVASVSAEKLIALRDALARQKFGSAYAPETGVVSYAQSQGHLVPELAGIPPRQLQRPDVRFFLERNPGYAHGDELVCLCELSAANMRPLTRRLFLDGAKR
ncbi:MAG: hypothetical protein ABL893_03020 [Hyphomicrobium sp.]